MYIRGPNRQKVFNEVFRVLIPTGLFLIWDVAFPERFATNKDIAVFPLLVKLPFEEISTSYGVLWPEEKHDLDHYVKLAENTGFNVVSHREKGIIVFLKLQKP
jgi:ubiquinone/menaquinone biosynthesis C-methylase UbiE